MPAGAIIENIATLVLTAVLILGMLHYGLGLWSLFGLLMLANLNHPITKKLEEKEE